MYISFYLPIYLSIYLYLSICLSIYLSFYSSTSWTCTQWGGRCSARSIYLFISLYLSIYPFIYLSSIYLSISAHLEHAHSGAGDAVRDLQQEGEEQMVPAPTSRHASRGSPQEVELASPPFNKSLPPLSYKSFLPHRNKRKNMPSFRKKWLYLRLLLSSIACLPLSGLDKGIAGRKTACLPL